MRYIASIGEGTSCDRERGRGEAQSLEVRHIGKSGKTIWCNLTMAAVRDPSGGLRYFIAVSGSTNKAITGSLNLSIRTVETHRANLMRKLGVHSTADLVRLTLACRLARRVS
ncbi:LuxR C-terminal-related transcriptional regulator [Thiocapsa sp.]|uniref:LuxR C-terminal-related transcriptional regulator n=1 Tax=Thiocapsa sp. TaxID=2024551 RepID=UPI0035934FCC